MRPTWELDGTLWVYQRGEIPWWKAEVERSDLARPQRLGDFEGSLAGTPPGRAANKRARLELVAAVYDHAMAFDLNPGDGMFVGIITPPHRRCTWITFHEAVRAVGTGVVFGPDRADLT